MKANRAFRRAEEAVSPVIGVILMVAITVVLAAVVFILAGSLSDESQAEFPKVTFVFSDTDRTARVHSADIGLNWTNFESTGCTPSGNLGGQFPSDTVTGGHMFTDCSGTFSLVHTPSNGEVAKHDFP